MNYIPYDTPEDELVILIDLKDRIVRVVRDKAQDTLSLLTHINPLDRELIVDTADSNTAIKGFKASIDQQKIIFHDTWSHGIALDPRIERGSRMLNELLVQIKSTIDIVLSRRRKASANSSICIHQR